MKRIALTILMTALLTLTVLTAEGKQETAESFRGPGYGPGRMMGGEYPGWGPEAAAPGPGRGGFYRTPGNEELEAPEELTLKGTVHYEPGSFPVLKTGGEEYYLLYPYRAAYDLEIKEGETLSVKGFTVPAPRRWTQEETDTDDSRYIKVTGATINGKEYILAGSGYGFGYCDPDSRVPRNGYYPSGNGRKTGPRW